MIQNKEHSIVRKEIFFSLNQRFGLIKALRKFVYLLKLFLRRAVWPMGILLCSAFKTKKKIYRQKFFSLILRPFLALRY